ncbi:NUDIX domain-containing protein [Patescibacteria group bacterium]|nr:NUDIX domain-containing protein [Patescibacteria group bacterium]
MPIEKSAGAVVFLRGLKGKIEYLLTQHGPDGNWGFSKGLIEKGEKLENTALREVKEEAGLAGVKLIDGFKETIRIFFKVKFEYQLERGMKMGETVLKFITYFLAESKNKEVKLSLEHSDYAWLEFEAALEKLKFKTDKETLKKANEFLNRISTKSI